MNVVREGLVVMSNHSNGVVGVHGLSAENVFNNNAPLSTKNNGVCSVSEPEPVEHQSTDCSDDASIDIIPRNVVCSFSVGCHLDLKKIAWHGCNVQYRPSTNVVLLRMRHPLCTSHIWSSGKVTCTGAQTEEDAKRAARRVARFLQKLGFPVKFRNYRIVNILATCAFPFGVKLDAFAIQFQDNTCYEPELHPGATYKCKDLSASLKIFSSGNVTITAPSMQNVQLAVEHVYPLCSLCRKSKEGGGTVAGKSVFPQDALEAEDIDEWDDV